MAHLPPVDWYIFSTEFSHLKVEVAALEEIKLVNIEFKKHDLLNIVCNHMSLCNLKRYEHEDSPQDKIF